MPTPIGTIIAFAAPAGFTGEGGSTAPTGWLPCDGSAYDPGTAASPTAFTPLFNVIGYAWGREAGSNRFLVPDLRARFLRGVAHGTSPAANEARGPIAQGGNPGDGVGSIQLSAVASHAHHVAQMAYGGGPNPGHWFDEHHATGDKVGTSRVTTSDQSPAGMSETRPVNVYVNWLIQYQ